MPKVHLVSFNVPYPADNGGLIDVFCKLSALKEAGLDVILHCYTYGRKEAEELKTYCSEVYYYSRNTGKTGLFHSLPYIVYGRRSEELVKRLANDSHPVILEGLHCSGILAHPLLAHKRIFVRSHNIEHDYYRGLAQVEKNIFKRYYFYNEAQKLENFEPIITKAAGIFAISKADTAYFSKKYPSVSCWNVPAFHLNDTVNILPGSSDYALYHGSLDVGENNHAALRLVNDVFSDLPFRFIIAGRNPSKELQEACAAHAHIELRAKVDTAEIQELVQQAHINVLPTWQSTGIKLKLLMALFSGRHCLVNNLMVKETGLEELCVVADSPDEMKSMIHGLFKQPFDTHAIEKRRKGLVDFTNKNGAEKIKECLLP